MSWKDAIKKEERIEDVLAFDFYRLGTALSDATFGLKGLFTISLTRCEN